jgi:uncharacterized delta-60 repeat protein
MIRRFPVLLACCLVVSAWASEYAIDPTFAPTESTPGWKRLFKPGGGTQDEKAVAFAHTADGGYVVCLSEPGGAQGAQIGLIRLDANGNLVGSFGTNGFRLKDAWLSSVTDMTIDKQGRIIVVGATPGPGDLKDFGVVRFNADGSDDTSFAGDGGATFGFDNPSSVNMDDQPTSVLAEADGKIVVAGNVLPTGAGNRIGVVRLNMDGSVDSNFGDIDDGHGGRRGTSTVFVNGKPAYAGKIVHIADDYFVVAGTSVFSGTDTDFGARILTPSGSPWAGSAGSATFPIDEPGAGGSLYDGVTAMAVVNPTTLVLAGTASGKFAAVRIVAGTNETGQYVSLNLDPTFLGSNIASRPYCFVGTYAESEAKAVGTRSDGRIFIAGRYTVGNNQYGMVTRLNPDGTPDLGYASNSGTSVFVAPTSSSASSFYTELSGVLFDAGRAVVLGSSVDNASALSDFDGVIMRIRADLIFANGFE